MSRPRAFSSYVSSSSISKKLAPQPVNLEQIIKDMSPPAVPSLSLAKTLAVAVDASVTPASLLPILRGLCSPESPSALRLAGFDIFTNYWENCPPNLSSKERFDWFSLFSAPYHPEQLRGLRTFVKAGAILGFEAQLIALLQDWLRSAEGDAIQIIAGYIASQSSRLAESQILSMLGFYESLVDHKLEVYINVYLDYLANVSPHILDYTSVMQLLFRALCACATPLPRLSLSLPTKTESVEQKISDVLLHLTSSDYASTCLLILKKCLFPNSSNWCVSYGAHRTLRLLIRQHLHTLLARAYIQKSTASGGWAGGWGGGEIGRDMLEVAWGPSTSTSKTPTVASTVKGWEAQRLGQSWTQSVEAWVFADEDDSRCKILEEAALALRDILQELDSHDEPSQLDDTEACTIGSMLFWLSAVVRGQKDSATGEPCLLPLSQPSAAQTSLLRLISSLLARDIPELVPELAFQSRPQATDSPTFIPPLHNTLLQMSAHLSDGDTARVILGMWARGDLDVDLGFGKGVDMDSGDHGLGWLDTWKFLLSASPMPSQALELPDAATPLLVSQRPLTSQTILSALCCVYEGLKEVYLQDARRCRRFLGDLVWQCVDGGEEGEDDTSRRRRKRRVHSLSNIRGLYVLWKILGDEVVLRAREWKEEEGDSTETGDPSIPRYLDLLETLVAETPLPSEDTTFASEVPASDLEEDLNDEDDDDARSVSTVDTFSRAPSFPKPRSRQKYQHHRPQSSSGSNSNFQIPPSSSTTSTFTSPSLASPVTNYTSSPGMNYNTVITSSPTSGSPLTSSTSTFITSPNPNPQHTARHHRNFSDQLRELSGTSSSSSSSPGLTWERERSLDTSRDRGQKEGEGRTTTMPLLSLLSSFTSPTSGSLGRHEESTVSSPSVAYPSQTSQQIEPMFKELTPVGSVGTGAVSALVSIFSQLAFSSDHWTPVETGKNVSKVVFEIFSMLVRLASAQPSPSTVVENPLPPIPSPQTRLEILHFLMRLRADRDHRVYFIADDSCDIHGQVKALAGLIGRDDTLPNDPPSGSAERGRGDSGRPSVGERTHTNISSSTTSSGADELRRTRPRVPERDRDLARHSSRGRTSVHTGVSSRGVSVSMVTVTAVNVSGKSSRSRSRPSRNVLPLGTPATSLSKTPGYLWTYTFSRSSHQPGDRDVPSSFLVVYDPAGSDKVPVLPTSSYLSLLLSILEIETNWDVLSYVLCHLPVQLANKHFFCGPESKHVISRILTSLCKGILNGDLGSGIDWGSIGGLKARDAHGLAYHTLTVLISYRRSFDLHQHHLLVETLLAGLSGPSSTIKSAIQALSLTAFELQSSTTKFLSQILEKLSQIMSSPEMSVHILCFLCVVASIPPLYANFTENDFKMVFGVALQYLQHHNRVWKAHLSEESLSGSWALSQHVRIVSYYLVYVWFLAVKLPDRPRHIKFITRQLLLANEGNDVVDDPTEVCFDWLARYTYASADPRPANSLLGDIVMNSGSKEPSSSPEADKTVTEKTWLLGHSVVTIRALPRLGWLEVLSRRPSGYTKLLCRLENAPMVGAGDPDPDVISGPASLLMERDLPRAQNEISDSMSAERQDLMQRIFPPSDDNNSDDLPVPLRPDPVTGYVWSGSAPSQRRKEVVVDPAFFALQLSAYPDRMGPSQTRMLVPPAMATKFFNTVDRIPVIDTHKVGIMYVAPGQTTEAEILRNAHGSPAYTRFLEGIGRLINLRGQLDVYAGGLDPDEDGEHAYAWWDDIGQILYHTATMMPPPSENDPGCTNKKRHIGNDYVRIVWNDSGLPYRFDTLSTQFQFVNIVIEPHSLGAIAAFSNNLHEHEYFKITVQGAEGMMEFTPVGDYKLISAENLPLLVRQLSLLADWFAGVFAKTERDTARVEVKTNWQGRLEAIRRFRESVLKARKPNENETEGAADETDTSGVMGHETYKDFTNLFTNPNQ